jgi:protein-disulfide isomerase
VLSPLACAAAPRDTPKPAVGADEVLVEAGDVKITRAELEKREANRLAPIRQQEYQLLRQAASDMMAERLLDKEAAARGVSRDALLKEIDAKAEAPAQAEVISIFDQNKQRLPAGMTEDEAKQEIQERLRQRNVSQARTKYKEDVLARSGLRIHLDPPRTEVVIPAIAPATGPDQAPVTIVEFSDYQCPYCQKAEPTVQEVLSRYPGKIRLVHRDFPLDNHQRALPVSRAAYCAGEQGKFWEYHRNVYSKPTDFSDEDLKKRAGEVGLDAAAFGTCYASNKHDETIRGAAGQGSSLGVTGTPTFFINGRMLVGAQPFEAFRAIIDEELAAK